MALLARTTNVPEWVLALAYIGVGIWAIDRLVRLMTGPGFKVPNPIIGAIGTTALGYLYSLIQQASSS